jgi:flavodoxin I
MSKVKIVYGTGGGNTEIVCERVKEILENKKHKVELLKAKVTEPEDLGDFDLLILASPTYGHGQLEKYFGLFLRKMDKYDFKGKTCGVIGLGDPKYDDDYHIESAKVITHFLRDREADILYMPLRVSRCPLRLLENHVAVWAEKIAEKI